MSDYHEITETSGLKATHEQKYLGFIIVISLLVQFAKGRDVLEVACGSGIGLGYIAKVANYVVGGDVDKKNVNLAREHYKDRIKIEIMDAHNIPFPEKSFDLLLLYEAIYYLKEPQKFIQEACRVLKDTGVLIICTVNKDWKDFHPSPYTHKYFSVPELYEALQSKFKEVDLYGAFRVEQEGIRDKLVSFIKRAALNFNLIPGSLKARAYLKRIFMGKLTPLPKEIYEGMVPYEEPVPIPVEVPNKKFKIIYAVARK